MKLPPKPQHRQLNLSLRDQPLAQLPASQSEELALALMEMLLDAAASESLSAVDTSGGQDESETHQ